jgi:peptidyl-dipeptidase Dcp
MRQQLDEIEAIARQSESPTFANTIERMEGSGRLLARAAGTFFSIAQANTNDTLQRVRAQVAPKLAAHSDAIFLDARLFARIKAVFDRRATLGLDADQQFLVERYYRDFVRAGALLSDEDKVTLRALNQEESTLTTDFRDKLLKATNEAGVVVEDRDQLAGLEDGELAAAARAAAERNLEGKWVVSLRNTTQQPVLASLQNRDLRRRILEASMARGRTPGETDLRAGVRRLAALRAQRATLLGFATHAAYVLDDQMAKTPEAAQQLLTNMVPAATARARREVAAMQEIMDRENGGSNLEAWDWQFYAEKVRKAQYDLEEAHTRPYFEVQRVLRDGVFFAANLLYGLTFSECTDIPVYHPDVRVFEVLDADDSPLALFYVDLFARSNKSGGAWMGSFVRQCGLLQRKPVLYNVCNFTKPADGQPALLSFDDVNTMFHEFGHALHGLCSDVRYPTVASTNVPRDFVEFPSQFNEHWALEPSVLRNYAKHYETGETIPPALVDKIEKAKRFNQGYATTEYLAAALLDLAWHTRSGEAEDPDVEAFECQTLSRFGVDLPQVPPRYRTTYFAHIWPGGYSAGYYAYLWSEVLDHDTYHWFQENGGMTRANGQRFREMILSRGGTRDAAELYRQFRGRDPSVEPLLEERGLRSSADGVA